MPRPKRARERLALFEFQPTFYFRLVSPTQYINYDEEITCQKSFHLETVRIFPRRVSRNFSRVLRILRNGNSQRRAGRFADGL